MILLILKNTKHKALKTCYFSEDRKTFLSKFVIMLSRYVICYKSIPAAYKTIALRPIFEIFI